MSSETLSVLAYNVRDGLGFPVQSESIVDLVEELNPTVAIFSEAYSPDDHNPYVLEDVESEFGRLGYIMKAQNQEMHDDREDSHALVMIAKREQASEDLRAVPLAGRYAIQGSLYIPGTDQLVDVFGHHGNDKSEALRVADTLELLELFNFSEGSDAVPSPTIVAGDLNRMDGTTIKAAALRAVGRAMSIIPALEPTVEFRSRNPIQVAKRVSSLSQRLGEMAKGYSLELLEGAGLEDVDPDVKATMKKLLVVRATLDYIMKSPHFTVQHQEVIRNLTIGGHPNARPLSDHAAKYAELTPVLT